MKHEAKIDGDKLEIRVEGRLDTGTAPELQKTLTEKLAEEIATVIFDFEELEYISSAGLRVLLLALKLPAKGPREVILKKPNERIYELLETTGFDDIMTIEK